MDLEAAKLAVDGAKDTQLITMNKLLSPAKLGTGSRSGSDSEEDPEAHLQPYAVEQEPAEPANGVSGSSSQKQRLEKPGSKAHAATLCAAAPRPVSAGARKTASQPGRGPGCI